MSACPTWPSRERTGRRGLDQYSAKVQQPGYTTGGPGGTPRDVPTLVTWPGAGEMHRCPAATEQMAEAVSCAGTSPRSRFPNKTGFDGARPDFWLLEGP